MSTHDKFGGEVLAYREVYDATGQHVGRKPWYADPFASPAVIPLLGVDSDEPWGFIFTGQTGADPSGVEWSSVKDSEGRFIGVYNDVIGYWAVEAGEQR